MEFHSIANVFPLLEGEELANFVQDVRTNGLVDPIITYQEKILDGRNRFKACQETGVEPRFAPLDSGTDPYAFVFSHNIMRRHLTPSLRASAASALANMQRGGTGGNRYQKARNRPAGPFLKNTEKSVPATSINEAAAKMGAGVRSTRRALRIRKRGTPEDVAAMEKGEKTVTALDLEIQQREGPGRKRKSITHLFIGRSPEVAGREIIAALDSGDPISVVLSRLGMPDQSGRQLKEIVGLIDDGSLLDAERAVLSDALDLLQRTHDVGAAHKTVLPILTRLYGAPGQRRGSRHGSLKRPEVDPKQFMGFVVAVSGACKGWGDTDIPPLGSADRKEALVRLTEARRTISKFMHKLKDMQND